MADAGSSVSKWSHVTVYSDWYQYDDLTENGGRFIGRVNGILSPLFTGAMVLTMSVAGILKEQFSLVVIFEAKKESCLL